jgi:transcriptional regulator with XRE-family HTH domain
MRRENGGSVAVHDRVHTGDRRLAGKPAQGAERRTEQVAEAGGRSAFARNMARQRELYGEPLGDRIRRLQGALGVSQARLAEGLGLSTAMLSQLVSARRVKIGDPGVLARLVLLERYVRRAPAGERVPVEELLAQLRAARPHLSLPAPAPRDPAESLRAVAEPAQLAAAACVLGPRFPAIAELLRRASVLTAERP